MRRPLFLVCLCIVLAVWWNMGKARDGTATDLSDMNGCQVIVTGRVYQKDTDFFYLDSIILEQDAAVPQQMIPISEKLKTKEKIICEYSQNVDDTEILLGSTVRVCGSFSDFSRATNPGEFDRRAYYQSIKICGKLRQATLLECSSDYSGWRENLYQLKKHFHVRLYDIFPEKEASVMCTMLLGEKRELDSEIKELYQRNGIVHILSISGLHITIIGMGIYRLLRRMGVPVWMAAFLGGSVLSLYGVMTGMSVSAVRAIGMYLLKMFSEVVGRTYDMLTALGIMAAILVWGNPGYLDNAGFYLSFEAVLGIGMVYPALLSTPRDTGILKYEGNRWKPMAKSSAGKLIKGLQQSIFASLSITLTTLPVQLWFYYEVPVYSVFLNLLVLPFMSLVMTTGLLAMLVPGWGILGTIDCLVLSGYERLCLWCEHLPFHIWNPGKPEFWQVAGYYLILIGMVLVKDGIRHRDTPFVWKHMTEWVAGKQKGRARLFGKERKGEQIPGKQKGRERKIGIQREGGEIKIGMQREKGEIKIGVHREKEEIKIGVHREKEEIKIGVQRERGEIQGKQKLRVRIFGKQGERGQILRICMSGMVQMGILTMAVMILTCHFDKKTIIAFLDVGQGDCICVQTASGEVYLFDCGSSSRSEVGNYVLKPYLKYYGIHHIDAVFLSHSDSDHCNGAEELITQEKEWGISVGRVFLPGEIRAGDSWESHADSRLFNGLIGRKEKTIRFTCLHPAMEGTVEGAKGASEDITGSNITGANADSQCFYIELENGISILLTGDVEGAGEESLLQELRKRQITQVSVLKVAHHGSKYATSDEFLEQICPKLAVISCGRNNSYGHPHKGLLDRLEENGVKVLRTDEMGAVEMKVKGDGAKIVGYVQSR